MARRIFPLSVWSLQKVIISFVSYRIWWENVCLCLNKSSYILISLVKHESNCLLSDLSAIILLFEEQKFPILRQFLWGFLSLALANKKYHQMESVSCRLFKYFRRCTCFVIDILFSWIPHLGFKDVYKLSDSYGIL